VIEKRLKAAAEGDFVIVLYNPSSHNRADHLKRAAEILKGYVEAERICGIASLIGREGQNSRIFKLSEIEEAGADMFSTVFIGSSTTKVINGKMVTPRGYRA
jgi:precorrin-3B C17-methyltransferase